MPFANYISEFFQVNKNGFAMFTADLLKKFRRSLLEIATNTTQHSESNVLITCVQHFPNEHKIKFTMADAGIGFSEHIRKNRNLLMNNTKAIKWALTANNSARPIEEGISGGLGLKGIQKVIEENKGEMYILSYDGWYQNIRGVAYSQSMYPALPGTILSITMNCQ
jgi:anti-sigma regulatory factor (Ser/Thr protein kinase)